MASMGLVCFLASPKLEDASIADITGTSSHGFTVQYPPDLPELRIFPPWPRDPIPQQALGFSFAQIKNMGWISGDEPNQPAAQSILCTLSQITKNRRWTPPLKFGDICLVKKSGSADRYQKARVIGLDYHRPVKIPDNGIDTDPGDRFMPRVDADPSIISRVLVDFDLLLREHSGTPPTSVFRGDVHKIRV